jgi:hypothetical protein
MREFRNGIVPEFLLGVLNSRLMRGWCQEHYVTWKVKGPKKLEAKFLAGIGIRQTESKIQIGIIQRVREILLRKSTNCEAETEVLEGEVDALVCQLYGLTKRQVELLRAAVA